MLQPDDRDDLQDSSPEADSPPLPPPPKRPRADSSSSKQPPPQKSKDHSFLPLTGAAARQAAETAPDLPKDARAFCGKSRMPLHVDIARDLTEAEEAQLDNDSLCRSIYAFLGLQPRRHAVGPVSYRSSSQCGVVCNRRHPGAESCSVPLQARAPSPGVGGGRIPGSGAPGAGGGRAPRASGPQMVLPAPQPPRQVTRDLVRAG